MEKIWQCERLSSEQRDACLLFSLFHLLRRRFFGFACAESPRQKTHDFVFKVLLAKNERAAIDYDRVFKVIDVELAFMYDFFFTKYAALHYQPRILSAMLSFLLIIFASYLAITAVSPGSKMLHVRNSSPVTTTTTADIVVTLLMLTCIVLLEVLQLLLYWTTIWGTVCLACHSVKAQEASRTKWWRGLKRFLSRWASSFQTNTATRFLKETNATTGGTSLGSTPCLNQCATIPPIYPRPCVLY